MQRKDVPFLFSSPYSYRWNKIWELFTKRSISTFWLTFFYRYNRHLVLVIFAKTYSILYMVMYYLQHVCYWSEVSYGTNHTAVDINADSNAHTQTVERVWRETRANTTRYGNRKRRYISYLAKFLFRQRYDLNSRIVTFLKIMAEIFFNFE